MPTRTRSRVAGTERTVTYGRGEEGAAHKVRLRRGGVVIEEVGSLARHRLLGGDGMVALIDGDATIDWWCRPELDDDPALWRLLDRRGRAARWLDARGRGTDENSVGPTLVTQLEVRGTLVTCRDAL